jgi:sensor histidine kinase regulating citrate/malate metabolism
LLALIQHIGRGILAYNEKEEIQLLNLAAKRLLQGDKPSHFCRSNYRKQQNKILNFH